MIRRAEDLRAVYLDTEHFSNHGFSPFARLIGETWQMVPAESDRPAHTAHRMLLNPLFTPKKMAALDGKMRDYARGYIARFKDRGACEFMGDFAFRFPIEVRLRRSSRLRAAGPRR